MHLFLKGMIPPQPVTETERAEDLLFGNDGYNLKLFDKDHHLNQSVAFVNDH